MSLFRSAKVFAALCLSLGSAYLGAYQNGFEVYLEPVYQCSDFKWHLDSKSPTLANTFTSSHWHRFYTPEVRGGISMRPFYDCDSYQELSRLFLVIEGGRVISTSGHRFDSTFLLETPDTNKTLKEKHKSSIAGSDFNISLGYDFFCGDSWIFIPTAGYASFCRDFHAHRLNLLDQGNDDVTIRHFKDDDTWRGAWAGLYAEYSPCCSWKIVAGCEYHYANYQAKTKWLCLDQRPDESIDTCGYVHRKGYFNGYKGSLAYHYYLMGCWKMTIGADVEYYSNSKTKAHTKTKQKTFDENGILVSEEKASVSQHCHVRWASVSISASVNYVF